MRMNAMSKKIVPAEEAPENWSLDDAHICRSKLVEKCADAEFHVLALLRARGDNSSCKTPFSRKIEALRVAATKQKSPGKADLKIVQLLEDLLPLADLRSELVHSTMERGAAAGRSVILFRNAAEVHRIVDRRVVLTLADLKDATQRLSDVVNQLKQLANPSSRPQPKPGAAACP